MLKNKLFNVQEMNIIKHSRAHNPAHRETSYMANKHTCTHNADQACLGFLPVNKNQVHSISFLDKDQPKACFLSTFSSFQHSLTWCCIKNT